MILWIEISPPKILVLRCICFGRCSLIKVWMKFDFLLMLSPKTLIWYWSSKWVTIIFSFLWMFGMSSFVTPKVIFSILINAPEPSCPVTIKSPEILLRFNWYDPSSGRELKRYVCFTIVGLFSAQAADKKHIIIFMQILNYCSNIISIYNSHRNKKTSQVRAFLKKLCQFIIQYPQQSF